MRTFNPIRFFTLVLAGGLIANVASAAVVADYTNDFPTSAAPAKHPGWNYQTNNGGPIGTNAVVPYTDLAWSSFAGGSFKNSASASFPDQPTYSDGSTRSPDPNSYLYMVGGGGHPGQGVDQQTGPAKTDRFAIAAFTLPQTAATTITGSVFQSTTGNTQELRVFVNDIQVVPTVTSSGTTTQNFDYDFGVLNQNDVIYVAVGPAGSHNSDGFALDFTINQVPEPAGLAVALVGLAGLSRRVRR